MRHKRCALCILHVSLYSQTFSQITWQSINGPKGGTFWTIYEEGQYAFMTDEYHFLKTSIILH